MHFANGWSSRCVMVVSWWLHTKSCHPRHCKTVIPFSQTLRLHRICSKQENLVTQSQELKQSLIKRGYPEQLLTRKSIEQLTNLGKIVCCLATVEEKNNAFHSWWHHPSMNFLARTTRRHQIILRSLECLNAIFNLPQIITFRRPKNLKDLLVHATLTSRVHEIPGNSPYSTSRCKTCPILKTTSVFTSKATGERFSIKIHTSCKTSNIFYLTREKKFL